MTSRACRRIQTDIKDIVTTKKKNPESLDGIDYFPLEDNIMEGYGLIRGPADTPYHRGFYIIHFKFPESYPYEPPQCTHYSVSTIRQSPNFHDCGKVCLSRLNTWDGRSKTDDKWLSTMDISAVLQIIRGQVLTPLPLDNEPNYDHSQTNPKNAAAYDEVVRYANFYYNVATLYGRLRDNVTTIPSNIEDQMCEIMKDYIQEHKDEYLMEMHELAEIHDGFFHQCHTYSNSSCYTEYGEAIKVLSKSMGWIQKINIKMKSTES